MKEINEVTPRGGFLRDIIDTLLEQPIEVRCDGEVSCHLSFRSPLLFYVLLGSVHTCVLLMYDLLFSVCMFVLYFSLCSQLAKQLASYLQPARPPPDVIMVRTTPIALSLSHFLSLSLSFSFSRFSMSPIPWLIVAQGNERWGKVRF